MKKVAVIDLGSNALRLVLAQLDNNGELTLTKKLRVPLRLGAEVFSHQMIGAYTAQYACRVFKEFKKIMDQEGIQQYKAVATSAFRSAKNKYEFSSQIYEESSLEIEGITGDKEAGLIRLAIEQSFDLSKGSFLLFDIGGGSIELSFYHDGVKGKGKSFAIGTVRLLSLIENEIEKDKAKSLKKAIANVKDELHAFIKSQNGHQGTFEVIGTGGNFKRLLELKKKILEKKKPKTVTHEEVIFIRKELELLGPLKRMKKFSLRHDRADVIVPALYIMESVFELVSIEKIHCPDIGLVHGVLFNILKDEFTDIKVNYSK
jgi:exopolyphosphatase / guanosine-5'-triphosphate,3'-diphosphate pyrophosphatase